MYFPEEAFNAAMKGVGEQIAAATSQDIDARVYEARVSLAQVYATMAVAHATYRLGTIIREES